MSPYAADKGRPIPHIHWQVPTQQVAQADRPSPFLPGALAESAPLVMATGAIPAWKSIWGTASSNSGRLDGVTAMSESSFKATPLPRNTPAAGDISWSPALMLLWGDTDWYPRPKDGGRVAEHPNNLPARATGNPSACEIGDMSTYSPQNMQTYKHSGRTSNTLTDEQGNKPSNKLASFRTRRFRWPHQAPASASQTAQRRTTLALTPDAPVEHANNPSHISNVPVPIPHASVGAIHQLGCPGSRVAAPSCDAGVRPDNLPANALKRIPELREIKTSAAPISNHFLPPTIGKIRPERNFGSWTSYSEFQAPTSPPAKAPEDRPGPPRERVTDAVVPKNHSLARDRPPETAVKRVVTLESSAQRDFGKPFSLPLSGDQPPPNPSEEWLATQEERLSPIPTVRNHSSLCKASLDLGQAFGQSLFHLGKTHSQLGDVAARQEEEGAKSPGPGDTAESTVKVVSAATAGDIFDGILTVSDLCEKDLEQDSSLKSDLHNQSATITRGEALLRSYDTPSSVLSNPALAHQPSSSNPETGEASQQRQGKLPQGICPNQARPFLCSRCGVRYKSNGNLERHKRTCWKTLWRSCDVPGCGRTLLKDSACEIHPEYRPKGFPEEAEHFRLKRIGSEHDRADGVKGRLKRARTAKGTHI